MVLVVLKTTEEPPTIEFDAVYPHRKIPVRRIPSRRVACEIKYDRLVIELLTAVSLTDYGEMWHCAIVKNVMHHMLKDSTII